MSTDGMDTDWEIIKTSGFLNSINLVDDESIEYALEPLVSHHLQKNPQGFDKVPGFETLYLVKTKPHVIGGSYIQPRNLWFRTEEQERKVHLLRVQISSPEDMAYSTDYFGDPWSDYD